MLRRDTASRILTIPGSAMRVVSRVADSGALAYYQRVLATQTAHLIAYWRLNEASGSTAEDATANNRDGAYAGVTLGVTGIGDGATAASFNGSTSVVNIHSAGLASAFNGAAGSALVRAKVSGVGIWTDGQSHQLLGLRVDANNRVVIVKNANNRVATNYIAGGTNKVVNKDSYSPTAWFNVFLTWDKAADQMKVYFDSVQEGTTQTGLGTWAGALLNTRTVIGADSTTPTAVWSGSLAHVAIWNVALSAAEVAALGAV